MKKKIFAIAVCVSMLAVAVVGGSLAYFTDTDTAVNTFTSGNVEIIQNEKDRNGVDYEDQKLLPLVDDGQDSNGYYVGENYVDKIVTVTNVGSEDAFVRTHIAIPSALDDGPTEFDSSKKILHWVGASASDTFGAANWGGTVENDWYWGINSSVDMPANFSEWNFYQTEVNGILYNVYVVTHKSVLAPGATTSPNLLGVYLDSKVDFNNDTDKYVLVENGVETEIDFDLSSAVKILTVSEAVQAAGFENYEDQENVAFYALDKAFGEIGSYNPFSEPQA